MAQVFRIASEEAVDLVIISGNLFHDNRPSRKVMQHAVETLRNHCLGDREVAIELVSDQAANFHGRCADARRRVSSACEPAA